MPPETIKIRTGPKDFFLHLGSMVLLYVSAVSLISLVFQTIDSAFPDQISYYVDPYSSGIRWAIASLVVAFPLYLLISWIINRDMQVAPDKASYVVRKTLIYFTLFIAGLTVMIDLIALINTFLGGEITVRFILKVLTVLVVAGGVFGYFIYDLRRADRTIPGKNGLFAVVSGLVVLVAVVAGFVIMGSPSKARDIRLDDNRVSALQEMQSRVLNYWQQKGEMPKTISDIEDSISGYKVPTIPDGSNYEYRLDSGTTFKLCATFSRPTPATQNGVSKPAYYGGLLDQNWQHQAGNHCFTRTIDPKLYPPIENTKGSVTPIQKY